MSILDSLRRFVDPVAHRETTEERRRKVEAHAETPSRPQLRCRVCGYEGRERFCPKCLAGTMK